MCEIILLIDATLATNNFLSYCRLWIIVFNFIDEPCPFSFLTESATICVICMLCFPSHPADIKVDKIFYVNFLLATLIIINRCYLDIFTFHSTAMWFVIVKIDTNIFTKHALLFVNRNKFLTFSHDDNNFLIRILRIWCDELFLCMARKLSGGL